VFPKIERHHSAAKSDTLTPQQLIVAQLAPLQMFIGKFIVAELFHALITGISSLGDFENLNRLSHFPPEHIFLVFLLVTGRMVLGSTDVCLLIFR
jgi:hypothetical protein